MKMPGWFKTRAAIRNSAVQLYGSSVAQARQPAFYAALEVPDTAEGRFEMIVLHLFLLVSRLRREGEAGQRLSQALMEAFVDDMDGNMREMGIGDMGVPRRVKKAAAGAYDRMEDYHAAFDPLSVDLLQAMLQSHIFGDKPHETAVRAIAEYTCRAMAEIEGGDGQELLAGRIVFPAPPEAR